MSDEAQADLPIPKNKPTEISEFAINLHLNATVEINGTDWVKPGVSGGMKWKGLPTDKEITLASKYIQQTLLEPVLEEILIKVSEKAIEKRRMS